MLSPDDHDKRQFQSFVREIGYEVDRETLQNVELTFQKSYTFLPELAVFAGSYVVRKTFQRHSVPPRGVRNNIRIFFHNVTGFGNQAGRSDNLPLPYVRISSSRLPSTTTFEQGSQVNIILVIIDVDYLLSFLNADSQRFPFLINRDQNFLLEELVTDDILRTAGEILSDNRPLQDYFIKLKTMELLYHLFRCISQRGDSTTLKLNEKDINAIYSVRDLLLSNLSAPCSVQELKKMAGMNEVRMRSIFRQIFGLGIYEYYQHVRMAEAARMLRDDKVSVSEAGYALGFTNLSHFTRLFRKHIGMAPKKYSRLNNP